jgi:hypothetical protein
MSSNTRFEYDLVERAVLHEATQAERSAVISCSWSMDAEPLQSLVASITVSLPLSDGKDCLLIQRTWMGSMLSY